MVGFGEKREKQTTTGEGLLPLDLTKAGRDFSDNEVLLARGKKKKSIEVPEVVPETEWIPLRDAFEMHPRPFSSFEALGQSILTLTQWAIFAADFLLIGVGTGMVSGVKGIAFSTWLFSFTPFALPSLITIGALFGISLIIATIVIEGLKPKPRKSDWMRKMIGWKV